MDWNKEHNPFQLAQFSKSSDGELVAPPLLGVQNSETLPRPQAVPSAPGAVPWGTDGAVNPRAGSTQNSAQFPGFGVAIPESGAPYPAAGIPNSGASLVPNLEPQSLAPAFPAQPQPPAPQVVRQVPTVSPFAAKSVQFQRRDSGTTAEFEYDETRGEAIGQIKGGFKLLVEGVQVTDSSGQVQQFGTVSLEADNAVVWMRSDGPIDFLNLQSTPRSTHRTVFGGQHSFLPRQSRQSYADRMYYNVSSEYGMVLSAEVLTPVPQYQGLLRLKADVLQQQNSRNYKAYGSSHYE